MTDETLTRFIRKKLRERKAVLVQGCASGVCKDFAAYKHITGQIEGLEDAEDLVLEAVRAYFGEEDSDDE